MQFTKLVVKGLLLLIMFGKMEACISGVVIFNGLIQPISLLCDKNKYFKTVICLIVFKIAFSHKSTVDTETNVAVTLHILLEVVNSLKILNKINDFVTE